MAIIKPISKVIVNGFIFTNKTTFEDVKKAEPVHGALWRSFDLLQNSIYPHHFRTELERYEGKQNVEIFTSNHIKYKNERLNNPEWFK